MPRTETPHVLAVLRLLLDLRQKELAALIDRSTDAIKSIEGGRLELSESLAIRISRETGVSLAWLLNNDSTAQIRPSADVEALKSKSEAHNRHEYTKETFHLVRARREIHDNHFGPIYSEQLRGLKDYARLRAVVESARSSHRYELARYKLNRFLREMEEEFGPKDGTFPLWGGIRLDDHIAIDFVEAEVRMAKLTSQIVLDVVTMEEEAECKRIARTLSYQAAFSPYTDQSDPETAAKIAAVLREADEKVKSSFHD